MRPAGVDHEERGTTRSLKSFSASKTNTEKRIISRSRTPCSKEYCKPDRGNGTRTSTHQIPGAKVNRAISTSRERKKSTETFDRCWGVVLVLPTCGRTRDLTYLKVCFRFASIAYFVTKNKMMRRTMAARRRRKRKRRGRKMVIASA